jgi:hypothetical protein
MYLCTSRFQNRVQGVLWIQELESFLCGTLAHLPHTLHRPAWVSEWHGDLNHMGQWDSGHWLGQDTFLEVPEARSYPQQCQEHRSTATTNFSGHGALEGWAMTAPWERDAQSSSLLGFFQRASHLFAPVLFNGHGHPTKVAWCDGSKLIYFWQWKGIGKLNPSFLGWLKDRLSGNR